METMQIDKVKKLVPELRFKGFEGEFEYKKLGDVSNVIMGQSPDSKSYNENGEGYYLIQGNADIKNRISSPRQWTNMPTKTCEIGDVILTVRAPVGAVAKSLHNACIGRGVCVIRNLEKYDLEYIFQFLLDFETKWGKLEQGSTFTAVSGADIKSIKFFLPSLPEQTKIASFLSAVDQKIQQLTRKKELLEQYKKGVMQKIFAQELRFKPSPIEALEIGDDYPDWEEKKLGKVAEKRIIKNRDNKINLVFTNSAVQGIVNQRDFFDKDIANQNNLSGYYIVEKDDFVYNPRISTYAPVGPISRNHLDTGIMSPLYSVFRFNFGKFDFIEYFFNSTVWHKHMKDISNYGARDDRMSFSTNDFYKMLIPFPCIAEQTKIAKFLSTLDEKINQCQAQIEKTEVWKKGLLQKMFV